MMPGYRFVQSDEAAGRRGHGPCHLFRTQVVIGLRCTRIDRGLRFLHARYAVYLQPDLQLPFAKA